MSKNFLGSLINNLFDCYKRNGEFPKISFSANKLGKNDNDNFLLYYSLKFNKIFLIAKFIIENNSAYSGKLYNVSLNRMHGVHGELNTEPMNLTQIKDDPVLYEYLCSSAFNNCVIYDNELPFSERDVKTVLFVFDTQGLIPCHPVEISKCSLNYRYSSKHPKTHTIDFYVNGSNLTPHYKSKEIKQLQNSFKKAKN